MFLRGSLPEPLVHRSAQENPCITRRVRRLIEQEKQFVRGAARAGK